MYIYFLSSSNGSHQLRVIHQRCQGNSKYSKFKIFLKNQNIQSFPKRFKNNKKNISINNAGINGHQNKK